MAVRNNPPRSTVAWFAFVVVGLLAAGPARGAHPVRLALVIGETAYAALPPLPACAGSANVVASALKHRGFEVVRKIDATNGETGAALASFAQQLTEAPGSTGFIYFCGYASGLDTRGFLLPVSATIERPTDLLTQGIVARAALGAVAGATAGGLLVLDTFAPPGSTTPAPLDRLAQGIALPGQGYLAAAEGNPADAPTPLAAALARGFAGPAVDTASLVDELKQRIAAPGGAKLIGAQTPASPGFLVGAPPPSPEPEKPAGEPAAQPGAAPPPAPPTAPAAERAPAAPAVAPAAPPSAPPPAAAAAENALPPMPGEDRMTEADRRRVQAALAVIGYYDGRIDGQFGPETRAAIRRFQHEIGTEMIGRLTSEQAQRLVAGHR